MISNDILAKIKHLEIKTKRLIFQNMLGEHKSLLKGDGYEFESLRDYEPGDDIRFIDWKSSARTQKILVKKYLENRNKEVVLLVDISHSTNFGSGHVLKSEIIKEFSAILAFVSFFEKDSISLCLFSDHIEFALNSGNSKGHVFNLVKKILTTHAKNGKTNINNIFNDLLNRQKRKAIICIFSDFIDHIDYSILKILSKKHELLLFQFLDKNEIKFPNVGLLTFEDIENKNLKFIDTEKLNTNNFFEEQKEIFKKIGIFHSIIDLNKPSMPQLIKCLNLFQRLR